MTTPVTIEAAGSTKLLQDGGNYYLAPIAGSTGPTLKINGAPVAGTYANFVPIGAEINNAGTGYQVAWHNTITDLYMVWLTDSDGNYLSTPAVNFSGASVQMAAYEIIFNQDLNNDALVSPGPVGVFLETAGSASLIQSGVKFYLGGTNGPALRIGGADVTAATYPGWLPVGVETTATGFQVAWHDSLSGRFLIWSTDSGGNFNGNLTGVLEELSVALETYETTFQQDLNHDGTIGFPPVTIESAGSTSLVAVAGNYLLGTSGPVLKIGGVAVTPYTYTGWAPIGVEAAGSGYQVVWNYANLFTVWTTDAAGNFLANQSGVITVESSTLIPYENSFHQDLNQDGLIGTPSAQIIESAGATSLVKVGAEYHFGSGAGPLLKIGGVAVTSETYAGWSPGGVEPTATGFQVAWHNQFNNQFTVWSTDANGNFVANLTGVFGSSPKLWSAETSFHQDFDQDSLIGPPSRIVDDSGSTYLIQTGDQYLLGVGGPVLKVGGVAATDATYPGWVPVSAEAKAGGGFLVAWRDSNAGHFSVWSTDSNGNFVTNQTGVVAANSATLISYEPTFHQDLNLDGSVGPSPFGAAPLSPGQDAFVFKANSDPARQDGSNGLTALETLPSGTELRAIVQEALQPHDDLFAAVSADLNAHDAYTPSAALADLVSGHFLVR